MQPEKMSVDCDGDDEEMLKKAIALSLEEETGVNSAKGEQGWWAQLLSGGTQAETMSGDCDDDDEEMLKKAIAMSLEEKTGVSLANRENKAKHNNF